MNTRNQETSKETDKIHACLRKQSDYMNRAVACGAVNPAVPEVVDALKLAALRLMAAGPDKDKIMAQVDVFETLEFLEEAGFVVTLLPLLHLKRTVDRLTVAQAINEIVKVMYSGVATMTVTLAQKTGF